MHSSRMDSTFSILLDITGANERIFKSPIPLVYTRLTSRFLTFFLVLLPLALWGQLGESWNHWATIPAEFVTAFFLFGIEEVGIQVRPHPLDWAWLHAPPPPPPPVPAPTLPPPYPRHRHLTLAIIAPVSCHPPPPLALLDAPVPCRPSCPSDRGALLDPAARGHVQRRHHRHRPASWLKVPSALAEVGAPCARPVLYGPRPLLCSPERRLGSSKARRGLRSSPQLARKMSSLLAR